MNAFTVYKILQHDTKQLLLVQGFGSVEFQLSVYDEHTGTTLKRLSNCTIEEFEEAIKILRGTCESQ